MADLNISNDVQRPRKLNKVSLVILSLLLIFLSVLLTFCKNGQNEAKVASQLATAQQLIDERKLHESILLLDSVIADHPDNTEAYRLRSIAYGNSRSNIFYEQQGYFKNSLRDADKLIELEPTNGNHYVDRNLVLRTWADMVNDSATKFHLYELAEDNTEKAIELGVSSDYSFVYRHRARNLIESNHCEKGLSETQALINQTSATDPLMAAYNIYLTEAYICLNKLEKALETAQKIPCEDPVVIVCKPGFMAVIYYQMGEFDQALDLLNSMVDLNPMEGAWRYFIRAAIFYENGEKELALQDLSTGDDSSWEGNGIFWYVKSKIAFEDRDNKNGTLYLQKAESTLDVQYMPLRQKILKELKRRGIQPLTVSPTILFDATPIP